MGFGILVCFTLVFWVVCLLDLGLVYFGCLLCYCVFVVLLVWFWVCLLFAGLISACALCLRLRIS